MIVYPQKASIVKYIKDIVRFRDLLFLLSKKWIKTKYEHSYIGVGWVIINPLITTIVYTIFFGMAFKVDTNQFKYFIFIYSGMLPWLFFKDTFIDILDIFAKEPHTIKRTNFPRIIMPLSSVFLKLLEFGFGLVVLFVITLVAGRQLSYAILLLPVLVFQVMLFAIGLGLIFLVPCLIYRDIKHLLKFVMPLGLYSLPIIYKITYVPDDWLRIYTLNPMVSVIQSFRAILFQETVPWWMLTKGMCISVFFFTVGFMIFLRYDKKLADMV